jgi:hypothetical protein
MRVTGEIAVRLAETYGLPIQKEPDEREGYRADIPLEDAQWILRHGESSSIFVEAEPELVESVTDAAKNNTAK